jgi:trans-aconitate methyltransferase
MPDIDRRAHWDNVYATKDERSVSWFQENPAISLDLIHAAGAARSAAICDIGGGASRLVDALVGEGFQDITVLDISAKALAIARARLACAGERVRWIAADVTTWRPERPFDLWHDRAVFHFLTDAGDRAAYAERVAQAVKPGGHVIIGAFAPDGPERCSGLPVMRHDAASIGAVLGPSFTLLESRRDDHRTPGGAVQHFHFSRFRRSASPNA